MRQSQPTLLAILGVALFITLVDNQAFFASALAATQGNEHRTGILFSMFALVAGPMTLILALAPGRRAFKALAGILLLAAAGAGYFMSKYGVLIDSSMIRNLAETDVREASPLVTPALFLHIGIYGLAPAILVFLLPLGRIGWKREFALRVSTAFASIVVVTLTVYANFAALASFGAENHGLRMQMNPLYPLYAVYSYATRAHDKPPLVREPIDASRRTAPAPGEKPLLLVFVMGETARADRFSLNGYTRDTNRYTREHDVVNFPDVRSCGTSTADSVPCLFSGLGHAAFSHAAAARQETLPQLLARLGVAVAWRDNSTGCKHLCLPATYEALAGANDPALCHDNVCVDEILLKDFTRLLADGPRDRFIVLHQRGSHGPAYYTDTPLWSKGWLPECQAADLPDCTSAEINNAYDNTILYTDYFLARVIEKLDEQSAQYRTAMIYVSDHGESLGENGLFLHGLPYSIAPDEQTRVPMLFWASRDFYVGEHVDRSCLQHDARQPTSHDAIFHSVLPLFDVTSPVYDQSLDVLAGCRGTAERKPPLLSRHTPGSRRTSP
jgi:lipid A ethanolaminephosphotransferase